MSNTLRKVDTTNEGYIEQKKIKKIDKKHQQMLVADGSTLGSIYGDGEDFYDQKSKKILKKEASHKERHLNHQLQKNVQEDEQ